MATPAITTICGREAACATDSVSRVTPTATIATIVDPSKTGTIARTEGPSVPVYCSTWLVPVSAVSMLPM